MSNEMFPLSRAAFANGQLDWLGDDWRIALIDDVYVYDPLHEFYDDVSANVIAFSANLTGKTNVGGVLDATDVSIASVAIGDNIEGIILYQWTGVAATSRVVLYLDTTAAAVLIDYDTDGGNVNVRWNNGPTKIFRL